MLFLRFVCAPLLAVLVANVAYAQNLVPNPSFEDGDSLPTSWVRSQSEDGDWESFGRTGERSISISGTGVTCLRRWQTTAVPVQPGQPYVFRFWGMASNVVNNASAISGFNLVTRDLKLTTQWAPYSYITVLPNNAVNPILQLGQCQVNGKFIFDDVEVVPVLPLQALVHDRELGAGEAFSAGRYTFKTVMAGFNANYSRCLLEHTAVFATDGWAVDTGQHVIYRHDLAGMNVTNGQINLNFRYQQGQLIVETSADGQLWDVAGQFNSATPGYIAGVFNVAVNANSLPTDTLYVRLRTVGHFIVTQYELAADVPEVDFAGEGKTWFLERQQTGDIVQPLNVEETPGGAILTLELRNPTAMNREIFLLGQVTGSTGVRERSLTSVVLPQSTNLVHLELPTAGAGVNIATIRAWDAVDDTILLTGDITLNVTWFRDSSYGYLLPGPANVPIWWCEAAYKVKQERFVPAATNDAVTIAAARNEYEPFQLVLRPETTLSNVTVSISDFIFLDGAGVPSISATNVGICLVEYVAVTEPWGVGEELGNYPDPLPPLTAPFDAPAHTNQPLWFTVYVPKDAPAGNYQATITVQSDAGGFPVPVRLRVFDFSLSDVTHTKTAYGLEFSNEWWQLEDWEQRRAVWDLYMQNFRQHRISPFRPQTYARITFSVTNDPITIDFADFDVAMERYLDEFDFTCFNWDEERSSGTIHMAGHLRFTPEYRERYTKLMPPIMAHLREKGWFDKAYSFWFDEPLPLHYPFVREGMDLVQQAAPGLRRLLTIYPDPPLYDTVDIWAPIFVISTFTSTYPRWPERRQLGEEPWWYVASHPYSPVPNNFTDQPALYPRIRAWMAEKYGVTGEIYWQVAWPYAEGYLPWNPWTNAMSRSGSGGPWGNGNGLLLYPPTKTMPTGPIIAGPVNSLRWELLREAQEDREYFWLVKQLLARRENSLGDNHPAVLEGRAAYEAVGNLIASPLIYDQNPQSLYAVRLRVAEAIEALEDGAPVIVRDPKTQAVSLGSGLVVRTEALGWPLPAYQWQLNGTNLPGATSATLALNNIGLAQVGDYQVIASNTVGVATSAVGRLRGYWLPTPQIVVHPGSLTRKAGSAAPFAVTAVSANPLSYQWLFNESPLPGATNFTLLLTNLSPQQAGAYRAVVSNVAGVVTSAVATLTVPVLHSNFTLISKGAVWRYHDQGVDLDTAWRATNYNDSGWSSGPAQLGFGDGDEQTVISYGPNPNNKPITTYFRHTFYNPFGYAPIYLVSRMLRDDGAVAYLNGIEIYRSQNLPTGTINYNTLAIGFWDANPVEDTNEVTFFPLSASISALLPGTNVLAVEVHQHSADSDDLSFDFELVGTWPGSPYILAHPTHQTRVVGQSANFTATIATTSPLAYQWHFDAMSLPGQTNATLALTNLNLAQAGQYSLVASNVAGVVPSLPATLTVVNPPTLVGSWAAGGAGFQLQLPPDSPALTVLASTNLTDWTELFSRPASAAPAAFTDTNAPHLPYRFYRLRFD